MKQKCKPMMWTVRILQLIFLTSFPLFTFAQSTQQISGIILDEWDEPVIGASVVQEGTTNGVISDFNGNFNISVPANSKLIVSYIGFEKQTFTVISGKNEYQIKLVESHSILDEVVVVGYGVQKKKLVTGATLQVKGEDIQKQNSVNPLGALQGITPGVFITQSSGMPGEGFKVNIRGQGTNMSSEPLYIINGVVGGNINDLNPADIESIDVLKDAASAAIYGSRAANGIILVTTKRGKAGKPSITYDGYVGWQNVYKMPSILNAREYAIINNEARLNDGLPEYNYAELVPNWNKIESGEWNGTNWMEEIRVKNAPTQNHALNITGGTEQSIYSIGLSYTTQQGILGKPVAPEFERYTFRLNTEHVLYKKNGLDILKVGENLTYTYKENSGIAIGTIYWNDIRNMLVANPFMSKFDENGEYSYAIPWNTFEANPVAVMDYDRGAEITKNKSLRGNIYVELQPFKNLKIRSNFGYADRTTSFRKYVPEFNLSVNTTNEESRVTQSMYTETDLSVDNTINYIFSLSDKHNFDVLLGQSFEKMGLGESISGTNVNADFNSLKYAYLNNTHSIISGKTTLSGAPIDRTLVSSFFGRVNYDYEQKYMLSAIFRADGSSQFAKGNRWGYFPSVSAGWVLTNESFMKPVSSWLDFFKLRVSWGQNGNSAIEPFQYLALISLQNTQYFFGPDKSVPSIGSYPEIIPNKDISWETSEQLNFGFDSRFLNSRLGLTFDIYRKDTKDWLLRAPILGSYGAGAPFVNGGDVRNKGVEIGLDWTDNISDFEYGVAVSIATNKNKVMRIANNEGKILGSPNILGNSTLEMYMLEEGFPMGYFYGYKTGGVFQSEAEIEAYTGPKLAGTRPGDLILIDTNKDGKITEEDRCMIGDPNPDMNLGFSINLAYKGFDLSLTVNGSFGHQIARSYRSPGTKDNYTTDIFGRWHGEGTSNKLPRLTTTTSPNWQYVSDIYIENGDYMRLQNLTVGYDLVKLFPNSIVSKARIYFAAQNLFTITRYSGMDPEVGHSGEASEPWSSGVDIGFYPRARTYMFGVNLKF